MPGTMRFQAWLTSKPLVFEPTIAAANPSTVLPLCEVNASGVFVVD